MNSEFVKETEIIEKNEEDKKIEIIKSILKTKKSLEQSHQNFEYAENELIDYYLYNIKANQSKLDYLLKEAKEKGINMNFILKKKYIL